jgi:tRNA(fMet)-specific endonuclease VapC
MENKLICLDTSVLIDFYRKRDKSRSYLYLLSSYYTWFAVTTITVFEIYSGSNESQNVFWDKFFQSKVVLPFDLEAAKLAVSIDKELKLQRKQIDIPDLFIAACAIENKTPLATLNIKHFERISNLEIVEKELL